LESVFSATTWQSTTNNKSPTRTPPSQALDAFVSGLSLGFLAAIGTIDAKGYPAIHSIGAVFFFIPLVLSIYITVVIKDMHAWDTNFCSSTSLKFKFLINKNSLNIKID